MLRRESAFDLLFYLVLSVPFFLPLLGCHTLAEGLSPSESSYDYYKTTNEKGETVYQRTRPVDPTHSTSFIVPPPVLEPIPTAPPGYSTPPSPPSSRPSDSSPVSLPAAGYLGFDNKLSAVTSDQSSDSIPAPNSSEQRDQSGPNSKKNPPDSPTSIVLEGASTAGHTHLGLHLSANIDSMFFPRVGASAFFSNETYLGFDFSARMALPFKYIQPFLGMGGYFGDTKNCKREWNNYSDRYEEVCEKKFLSAGYAEAGLKFDYFAIFVRSYNITRADLEIPTDKFFGLSFDLD